VIIGVLLALALIFLILFVHYFYPSRQEATAHVTIPEGATSTQIAQTLHDNGVITSPLIFRFLSWLEGKGGDFKAGDYVFNKGIHYAEAFSILEAGPNFQARFTIPEGLTVDQTASRVAQSTTVAPDDFKAAASSGDFDMEFIPAQDQDNLEGFLFPKTYTVAEDVSGRQVVEMLLNQFKADTSGLDWPKSQTLGITPYQAVITASLIEREAAVDDERPLIAAVIFNRLKKDMLLQIDATVQYALPEWKDVLTYDDLKVDSPYNTYLHKGLPPGPICSPGLASLEAALNPADVDYLYYVATGNGRHFFTSDYNEFLRVKNEVQKNQ
jgi:peptidoglycan lytic transglycosylase G